MTHSPDILAAAERALDRLLCNCPDSCGGFAGSREASIRDIADAILAERLAEREAIAAMVAEGVEWTPTPDPVTGRYLAETCAKLARNIRARGERA